MKVIGGAGRKRKLDGEGKGGSEPPKAADSRFLIESRSAGVLGGELTLGRAALLFSIQKICFQFLLSVFGADLGSLGFVCDGTGMGLPAKRGGWSDGGVAVGTCKKGKGGVVGVWVLLTCH